MNALKAVWVVTAGLVPGQAMAEFTRYFEYTGWILSRPEEMKIFTASMDTAMDYTKSLTDPRRVNWVKVDWTWF